MSHVERAKQLFFEALALLDAGNVPGAEAKLRQALPFAPTSISILGNLAIVLMQQDKVAEAKSFAEQSLAVKPDGAALLVLGQCHAREGRHDEALESYRKSIALDPGAADAYNASGISLAKLGRLEEALGVLDRAVALDPRLADAHVNRGNTLGALKRPAEALSAFDKALALNPRLTDAWIGKGIVQHAGKRYEEALQSYSRAIACKPDLAFAHYNRGVAFVALKHHEEAAAAFAEALKFDPDQPFTKGVLLHERMLCCEWRDLDTAIAGIEADVAAGKKSAEPFGWQALTSSPQSLKRCAEIFSASKTVAMPPPVAPPIARPGGKIRVGYSSGEFREQATSHLVAGLLEQHDKGRFDIYAFDNGWDDNSALRKRIQGAVSEFVPLGHLPDGHAAGAIRERRIDILVDLNGYFGEYRLQLFARRAAPVQVNYLGFPGTLGAAYMDYIVADACVIPNEHKPFYTEKVVHLPHCYQANDRNKAVGSLTGGRARYGLPENGFVFCCFNNNYKILPDTFDCWMRLLKAVEGGVLWLIGDNALAIANLKREATARSVDPARLIFADRVPLAEHLARHSLADLFLDTLPYNAHTTASDALWSGLPLVTCLGSTFPGRVGASLLRAIGMPELIAGSMQEYEALALDLARNPDKLTALRNKLKGNRLTTPLFDTAQFTRDLETAYALMQERRLSGLAPDHIVVPAGRS